MRRSPSTLLVALIATLIPLATPVSAEAAGVFLSPVASSYAQAAHQARHTLTLDQRRHARARLASLHVLDAAARMNRVSVGELRAQWQRVAICEVAGNWSMTGPNYSGIGFLNTTWSEYGGTRYAPLAGRATRDQQILIGMRVTNGWVPDQNGCSHNGW
jgi:hypothetical protein